MPHLNFKRLRYIIHEYYHSSRDFASTIRVVVDQLLLLLTENSLKYKPCDSIGGFLKQQDNSYDVEFLAVLNAIANFLKHHPYQLERFANHIVDRPVLLIMVNKKEKNSSDYNNLKEIGVEPVNDEIICQVDLDYLVAGFNSLYQQIKKDVGH